MRADRAAGTEKSAVQVSMCTGTCQPQSRFSHASIIGINSAPKRSGLNAVRKVTYRSKKIGFIISTLHGPPARSWLWLAAGGWRTGSSLARTTSTYSYLFSVLSLMKHKPFPVPKTHHLQHCQRLDNISGVFQRKSFFFPGNLTHPFGALKCRKMLLGLKRDRGRHFPAHMLTRTALFSVPAARSARILNRAESRSHPFT